MWSHDVAVFYPWHACSCDWSAGRSGWQVTRSLCLLVTTEKTPFLHSLLLAAARAHVLRLQPPTLGESVSISSPAGELCSHLSNGRVRHHRGKNIGRQIVEHFLELFATD